MERFSELVCPEAAAQYQECYTASLARGDIVLDDCSKQVRDLLPRSSPATFCTVFVFALVVARLEDACATPDLVSVMQVEEMRKCLKRLGVDVKQ